MPKVKLTDYKQKRIIARATIKNRMEIKQITITGIAKRLNKPASTLYHRFAHPEIMRLDDLWCLVSILGLSDHEILQIVRGKEDI